MFKECRALFSFFFFFFFFVWKYRNKNLLVSEKGERSVAERAGHLAGRCFPGNETSIEHSLSYIVTYVSIYDEDISAEGLERHKETGGIVTVSVASLPGNLLVMLISAYKPFITTDEQLIRLPAPWPTPLMHSECLSITRRHERRPQGRSS